MNKCDRVSRDTCIKWFCNNLNQLGQSPLQAACERGHVTVVQLLIDKGAEVNKFDKVTTTKVVRNGMAVCIVIQWNST